jgi:hypothetical protein
MTTPPWVTLSPKGERVNLLEGRLTNLGQFVTLRFRAPKIRV